jgi:sulfur-carrier protein
MIRVVIPYQLKMLAKVTGEVELDLATPVTLKAALDALEARYPMLSGTIRDPATGKRRPMIRFFACAEDYSNELPDVQLPERVATGVEPLLIVGAIAGG